MMPPLGCAYHAPLKVNGCRDCEAQPVSPPDHTEAALETIRLSLVSAKGCDIEHLAHEALPALNGLRAEREALLAVAQAAQAYVDGKERFDVAPLRAALARLQEPA